MDEDQESPTARRAGTITGRGVRFPPKAEVTGSNPVGRANKFNSLFDLRLFLEVATHRELTKKFEGWVGKSAGKVPQSKEGRVVICMCDAELSAGVIMAASSKTIGVAVRGA
jgi:hypothetical protein